MKTLLGVCCWFVLFSCVNNKSNVNFILLPEKNCKVSGRVADERPATGTVYIKTNSQSKKIYRWKKVLDTCPKDWHIYYCDNVSCYFIMPDSSVMHGIDASMKEDENRMKLYVEPNGKTGEGMVKIAVYDPADKMVGDTISYTVTITE